jgi:dTDP-4-dehydrorhamnose 3,5-epimerase
MPISRWRTTTSVTYQVSEYYTPGQERGLRYDDPALGIEWPIPIEVVSEKDLAWPLLSERAEVTT